jgi:hypothetical protein
LDGRGAGDGNSTSNSGRRLDDAKELQHCTIWK